MKSLLKRLMPRFVFDKYISLRRVIEERRNAKLTPQEVFSEIYRKKKWSDHPDSSQRFDSGGGSSSEQIVTPYVKAIRDQFAKLESKPRVVDLGCGDFSVGSRLVDFCSQYTGVDVVPELVEHLCKTHSRPNLTFVQLDMIQDELPDGDFCLIRQVLQHLSNSQIERVLKKLIKYSRVYITEHYPDNSCNAVPNLDKIHGSTIRLFKNSGVYLDSAPFNQYVASVRLILEVPSHGFNHVEASGVIRTFEVELKNIG